MAREDHRKELADLLAADREKRRIAEAEILRKERLLLAEAAKLARLNAENDELDAELAEARIAEEDGGGDDEPSPPQDPA
jgi:hypothetical protein